MATIVLGVAAWLVVLIGRASGVGLALYPFKHKQIEGTKRTLVWGGLRGGISLALVLSLPQGPDKTVFVAVTFFVVALSILGQGMTLERAIKPFAQKDAEATSPNT